MKLRPTIVAFAAAVLAAFALLFAAINDRTPVALSISSATSGPSSAVSEQMGTRDTGPTAPPASLAATRQSNLQTSVAFLLIGMGAALAASGSLVWVFSRRRE